MPNEPQNEAPPVALVNADGTFAENWKESLPEDVRAEACLDTVTDFPNAMKQLVHHKKMTGADKVVVPTDKSDPEVWDSFHKAAGRPDTADDYKVEVAEGLGDLFSDERMADARKIAHELGVSQKQFEAYMKHEMESATRLLAEQEQLDEQQKLNAKEELKKRFGGAYDERMHVANRLVSEIMPEGEKRMAFLEKFGNDPDFIEFVSNAGARLVEHKALVAELTQDTPGDAQAKIKELQKGYTDPSLSREDKAAMSAKLRELYKVAYPEPERKAPFVGLGV
jgi:hypothetical protein